MTRKSRRLAVLINDMNAAGGIQRVASNLVRDLGEHYDTSLLSVEPLSNPVFHSDELDFQSLDLTRTTLSRVKLVTELAAMGRRLRRKVLEQEFDTVLAIWYDMSCVAALALPSSVKTIGCEHISYHQASAKWTKIRSFAYPRLDAVVGLTHADLPLLARISKQALVIPNYVDHKNPPDTGRREKILLTVGHLDARKGIDRLLWALKQPLHENPEWKLVVVGGGEKGHVDWGYLDHVANLVNLLHLQRQVEFFPATRDIDYWYDRASIYVLGSRMEGLPMVLIEAKSHGLPVISFDCPTGPKEIVRDGIDGYLIPNDSEKFAEAANILIKDEALRRQMSEAAIDDARARFSRVSVVEKWRELIDGLHSA